MSSATRQKKLREARAKLGLVRVELWVPPQEVPLLQQRAFDATQEFLKYTEIEKDKKEGQLDLWAISSP